MLPTRNERAVPQKETHTADSRIHQRRSNGGLPVAHLFVLTLVVGFVAELTIMVLFFPHEPHKVRMALLDSGVLTGTLAPALYFLAFRPLRCEIAKRTQAENRAREACAEAERANQAKDLFIATLSHELRTPLSSILLRSEYLSRNANCPELLRRHVEVIASNARMQAQLIEDLLDVSRIASGKIRLQRRSVHLNQVIHVAIEAVRPAATAKGVRIEVALDPAVGVVRCDPRRMQQVVWNLLSNGVKFTERGGQVAVRTEKQDTWIRIRVSDTGVGISKEFLPRVFDLFSQADAGRLSTSERKGGLGLGLALVQQLTELHGGSVEAQSPGKGLGAVFTISLPVLAGRARRVGANRGGAVAEEPAALQVAPRLDGLRILVIDDDRDTREAVSDSLVGLGASVANAASAPEARRALSALWPDTILCDIAMPGEDGYDFIRAIRSRPPEQGGEIPAIALTALAGEAHRAAALAAGYQAYLSKPTDEVELTSTILRLVALRPASRQSR